jgi:hypothetical protein
VHINIRANQRLFRALDQFHFVSFRRVNERETAAIFFEVRSVGIFVAELFQMLAKSVQAIHLESQVRQVRLTCTAPLLENDNSICSSLPALRKTSPSREATCYGEFLPNPALP